MLWGLTLAFTFMIFLMGAFFGEQDAVWHQTAVRDTVFTPSHIVLFCGTFPLSITFSVGAYLYARTRLPGLYRNRDGGMPLSFVLMIVAAVLLMFQVALNESPTVREAKRASSVSAP